MAYFVTYNNVQKANVSSALEIGCVIHKLNVVFKRMDHLLDNTEH
jgi:hypothetical protein